MLDNSETQDQITYVEHWNTGPTYTT